MTSRRPDEEPNHPFVVWAACFLWLTSVFNIVWSLLLFFSVADILLLTGTDLVNAFVLLSGILMLPTNIHMLRAISHNRKLKLKLNLFIICFTRSQESKVSCCPLWLSITWIIIVNFIGAVLCIHRIYTGEYSTNEHFHNGMCGYKLTPKYKRLVDNIQWSLNCCGLNSYKDWFTKNWFDQNFNIDISKEGQGIREVDSVPLSCCKAGSCTSNYLLELGSGSINTSGCSEMLYRVVMVSMMAHAVMFCTVIAVELIILKFITIKTQIIKRKKSQKPVQVHRIMSVNKNIELTSASGNDQEEEDYKPSVASYLKSDIYKHALRNEVSME